MVAFYQNSIIIEKLFMSSTQGLSSVYISVIGTLIAILFTILITIVANSSSKYPTNFINNLRRDVKTIIFYFFLVFIILVEIIAYYSHLSSLLFDLVFMLLLFAGLFWYWHHILKFIDPIASVHNLAKKKVSNKVISELGDYAEIGIKKENERLTQEALDNLNTIWKVLIK